MSNLSTINEAVLSLSIDLREVMQEIKDLTIKRDEINKELVRLMQIQNDQLCHDVEKIDLDIFPNVIYSSYD
jgi:hypothetical protein